MIYKSVSKKEEPSLHNNILSRFAFYITYIIKYYKRVIFKCAVRYPTRPLMLHPGRQGVKMGLKLVTRKKLKLFFNHTPEIQKKNTTTPITSP